jgi:hydrogenase-4 component H
MLTIVLRNLFRPPRTRAPTDQPEIPATFRGALTHDAARCTACGTCAYVCAPKAIRFEEDPGKSITWQFTIGRCSFCGLCQQNCPTQAIGTAAAVPATMLNAAGDGMRLESIVRFQPCPRCGKPHIPLPDADTQFCPECRQWATSAGLRRAFLAGEDASHGR